MDGGGQVRGTKSWPFVWGYHWGRKELQLQLPLQVNNNRNRRRQKKLSIFSDFIQSHFIHRFSFCKHSSIALDTRLLHASPSAKVFSAEF